MKSTGEKKGELIFIAIVSMVLMVLTGAPYLIGWLSEPEGRVYDGLHALSPGDVPVYYSYIRQARDGGLVFFDRFTTEPQAVGTINVWWLAVGRFAGLFHLSVPLAFQLARLLMVPVFVAVLYTVIAQLFASRTHRRIALLFSVFASGVGGYAAPLLTGLPVDGPDSYHWPIDLWLTEASTFNALYQTSHFIASLAATLGIFLLAMRSFEKRSVWLALGAGALSFLYFNFHPYYAPSLFGALGAYLLVESVRKRRLLWYSFFQLAVMVMTGLPSLLYHVWLLRESDVIAARALQNVTTISPLLYVLIGYGFLLPGMLLGVHALRREKKFVGWWQLLASWLAVNIILIYSPIQFHSRYTQGVGLVLALFTAAGFFWLYSELKKRWPAARFNFWVDNPALLSMLFLLMFAPSTIISIVRDVYHFLYKPGKVFGYYYLPAGVVGVYEWLSAQPAGQTVLAFDPADKFIPGFSGQQTFAGHGHETINYQAKIARVQWFYGSNGNDEEKEKFLREERIHFVLWSEYEKTLGDYNPSEKKYLSLVFDSRDAKLYRVVTEW